MKQENAIIKRVFVSDIHMGDQRSTKTDTYPHPYGWFRNNDEPELGHPKMFNDFLKTQILKDDKLDELDELVILGDLFDEWVCPADFDPIEPGYENQLTAIAKAPQNQDIISNLKKIAHIGKLVYVPGNHDMLITESPTRDILINDLMPNVKLIWDQDQEGLGRYTTEDGIMAEHGHRFTLFNAPWAEITGQDGLAASILPMGHFIARLEALFVAEKGREYKFYDFLWPFFRKKLEEKKLYQHMNQLKDDHWYCKEEFIEGLHDFVKHFPEEAEFIVIVAFKEYRKNKVFRNLPGVLFNYFDDRHREVGGYQIPL